jgi:hypothetical protein
MSRTALVLLSLLTLLAAGCASHGADLGASVITGDSTYSSTDVYDVIIAQTASPMSFPNADKGQIDVAFNITFRNAGKKPVVIDRISLQSMGGSLYRLDTSSRRYQKEIEAGETFTFKFWAPAQVTSTTFDARAPMVVRAVIDTVVDGEKVRELFNREVNGAIGIGAGVGGNSLKL